jgi:hypothetical protein
MSRLVRVPVAASVFVCAGIALPVAHAGPPHGLPEPAVEVEPDRDPSTALTISIASTAASVALIGGSFAINRSQRSESLLLAGAATLIFTPGFGHGYGRGDLGTVGLALRASAIPIALASYTTLILTRLDNLCLGPGCMPQPLDRGDRIARGLAYSGLAVSAALVVAGTAYDLATVRHETREARTTRRLLRSIAPSVVQTQDGGMAPALAVAGAF